MARQYEEDVRDQARRMWYQQKEVPCAVLEKRQEGMQRRTIKLTRISADPARMLVMWFWSLFGLLLDWTSRNKLPASHVCSRTRRSRVVVVVVVKQGEGKSSRCKGQRNDCESD